MNKQLKFAKGKRAPKLGTFNHYAHPLVKFIWKEIIDRNLDLTSVADASGIDRSTFHKWRKSVKGPFVLQLDEVLSVLGYELTVVRKVDLDE